jgi:hypothetical protein
MKINHSTKLKIPVYGLFFKILGGLMLISATFLLAIIIYGLITMGWEQVTNRVLLGLAVAIIIFLISIWFARDVLKNKITVNNGRISWKYFGEKFIYIDNIAGVIRIGGSLEFTNLKFADKKGKQYTIIVNSKEGDDFVKAMVDTFGKLDTGKSSEIIDRNLTSKEIIGLIVVGIIFLVLVIFFVIMN